MIETIDITGMVPAALSGYPELVAATIPDIAEAVRTEIIRLAGERLAISSDEYIAGVQAVHYHFPSGRIPPGEHTVATIALVGWLPNAIENGWSGGDMKAALLSGRSAKMGKDGPYAVVPFRHGTPGGSNRNFQKMGTAHVRTGSMTHDMGQRMGRKIHRAAKKLRSSAQGTTRGGERLQSGHSPLLRPHHTTSIHTGMVRQVKQYTKSQGTQYKTFRGVSAKSRGWVHPGIEAQHIFKEAGDYTGKVAEHLLGMAVQGLHKGTK